MITATLNGIDMPPIEHDFLRQPIENAQDVQTIDGNIYTDFTSLEEGWVFNYAFLTEDQYDALRLAYTQQFTLFEYPQLEIPYYGVDSPARMYINEQNIWDNCGRVQNVQITFRLTDQINAGSS